MLEMLSATSVGVKVRIASERWVVSKFARSPGMVEDVIPNKGVGGGEENHGGGVGEDLLEFLVGGVRP